MVRRSVFPDLAGDDTQTRDQRRGYPLLFTEGRSEEKNASLNLRQCGWKFNM